jgi:hypothetical protein
VIDACSVHVLHTIQLHEAPQCYSIQVPKKIAPELAVACSSSITLLPPCSRLAVGCARKLEGTWPRERAEDRPELTSPSLSRHHSLHTLNLSQHTSLPFDNIQKEHITFSSTIKHAPSHSFQPEKIPLKSPLAHRPSEDMRSQTTTTSLHRHFDILIATRKTS